MTGLLVDLAQTREKLCLIRQCLLDHFRRSDPVGVAPPSIGLRSTRIDRGPEHALRDRLFAVPHPRTYLADQTDFFVDSQGFGPVLARHQSPTAALKFLCCCSIGPGSGLQENLLLWRLSQEPAAVAGSGPIAQAVEVGAALPAPVQWVTGSSRAVRTHCVGRLLNIAGSFQTA